MEITSSLIQFTEQIAICQVHIHYTGGQVSLYATGLAAESLRYADLAQERALELARRYISPTEAAAISEDSQDAVRQVTGNPVRLSLPAAEKPLDRDPVAIPADVSLPINDVVQPVSLPEPSDSGSSNIPW